MIDSNDKKTMPLLEEKRGRGRPKTGTAMTAAEKQAAYRARAKANSGNGVTDNKKQIEALLTEIDELKIALGKEVIARKKAESRKNNTELDQPGNGIWRTQYKLKNSRAWIEGEVLDRANGTAWSFNEMKNFVKSLESKFGYKNRAVRNDGLIYEPGSLA